MQRCPHCGIYAEDSQAKTKARCSSCREPLFERGGGPMLAAPSVPPDRGFCAIHTKNAAVGTCKRCGNFYCPVCRTRYSERVLCLACVERQLSKESHQAKVERIHHRQALWGFLLGFGAWVLFVSAIALLTPWAGTTPHPEIAALAFFLVIVSLLPSVIGLGQSTAAIRIRGNHMLMATGGLLLSGIHVGVFVGITFLLSIRV